MVYGWDSSKDGESPPVMGGTSNHPISHDLMMLGWLQTGTDHNVLTKMHMENNRWNIVAKNKWQDFHLGKYVAMFLVTILR